MNEFESDPILNGSSINSEDYWFLKLSNVDQPESQKHQEESAEKEDSTNK
ncbi:MAG: hypothetical protein HUK21_07375 [Fibrobacteraceae bacterium]|nr:hypothetical protein [Fibrobacteraceae bacterium]